MLTLTARPQQTSAPLGGSRRGDRTVACHTNRHARPHPCQKTGRQPRRFWCWCLPITLGLDPKRNKVGAVNNVAMGINQPGDHDWPAPIAFARLASTTAEPQSRSRAGITTPASPNRTCTPCGRLWGSAVVSVRLADAIGRFEWPSPPMQTSLGEIRSALQAPTGQVGSCELSRRATLDHSERRDGSLPGVVAGSDSNSYEKGRRSALPNPRQADCEGCGLAVLESKTWRFRHNQILVNERQHFFSA